ncbi:cob(I)yrinic acid a,c-diamide adenosyltransferase [Rhizobium laguerreae]|uniref:cob(I)yrinic acid a,c-diamide adenosyltransferase n=1 Tax=Rhizobium TaxID=379 RepID=UPI00138A47F9|nr:MULTISPECIES: cob(I)yrinic acid a,c-diamide adenosyltransferase [Rhizobium]MBW8786455.1 cob(I)yrinic acid a,c-diamide adenosyltransferase [Rhizobium leguminosarum]MBY5405604.1 cob(I)yrinic acid a,c-diamide adenosyltransferase [Rhizobium leguminosarum]NDK50184.1 cob(I)yrinic acid a,c-diamide adenosyltransferase [Rhizobium laguerreae]NNG74060.1 cob(I)yrinic acid a,c-diamide adenosyltransferase [Rhizobium laguerreae]NNH60603.1 cob(I)yrinic acid a,c-diamide adenosyltransferase [Rhizobium laguer
MVKLNKIYTKTGDDGTTGLVSGPRRLKDDLRVEAYGTIDEANSAIGLARLYTAGLPELDAMLMSIQNDLFDLGADLATPDTGELPAYEPLRISETQVDRVERDIDQLNADLQPLKSFILPGGSPAAAHLHLARTIARRAERLMVALARTDGEILGEPAMKYVNRLSDFLFVAARHANDGGHADVLWVPGKNR